MGLPTFSDDVRARLDPVHLTEALRATHGASMTRALDEVADALRALFPEADTVSGSGDQ